MGFAVLFAIGIVAFLFAYFLFKLREQGSIDDAAGKQSLFSHFPLQILLLFFFVGALLLVGKVAVDNSDPCAWLPMNATVNGSVTTYDYDYFCEDSPYNTATIFYGLTLWFARLMGIYLVLYFTWKTLAYFNIIIRREE